MIFDVHSHNCSASSIRNFTVSDVNRLSIDYIEKFPHLFTAGIHPWELNEKSYEKDLELLRKVWTIKNCVGVGEFGFDKIKGPSLALQEKCFKEHIEYLHSSKKKMVGILHVVKSYNELENHLKEDIPFIIHDFNTSDQMTKSLLKQGNLYFSVGNALFRNNSKIRSALELIPAERVFLETDDTGKKIEEVFEKFIEVTNLKCSVSMLMEEKARNFDSLIK